MYELGRTASRVSANAKSVAAKHEQHLDPLAEVNP